VRGVVKGTSSLVSNTTSGFLSVVGKFSSSFGRGLALTLAQDERFMQSRDKIAKERKDVHMRPVKDFFHGIFHGITGIIVDPYYGARKGEPGKGYSLASRRSLLIACSRWLQGFSDWAGDWSHRSCCEACSWGPRCSVTHDRRLSEPCYGDLAGEASRTAS
jgi:hypothetical protein